MTSTPTDVTQADFEAAVDALAALRDAPNAPGGQTHVLQQLFARHRLAHQPGDGALSHWLIERRCSPPQWSIVSDPTGCGAFYSDPNRAYRFPSRERAEEAMRHMMLTPAERGQYFVSEHIWHSLRNAHGGEADRAVDPDELRDFISDAITDSMDMDWSGTDGARAVVAAFEREGWTVIARAALQSSEVAK